MKALLGLAAHSLWSRRVTAGLTVFSIAVSVALLLGVQKVRHEARQSFTSTISGTDLVVGARGGPINLLLYSVFRIGDATTSVSWESFELVSRHPEVAWTIPLSLGDSHRGFRVVGTSRAYFDHYRYGARRPLEFARGGAFAGLYEAVIGAEVAEALGYGLDERITISHGLGEVSFAPHEDHPFRVTGILARTGTPVDRSVHVSLEAVSAIHADWESGMHRPSAERDRHDHPADAVTGPAPPRITAFLVGMKSPSSILQMQRALNEYRGEPLLAIMPGVTLQQLWELVGIADTALMIVAACVVLAGLLGMITALLTSLNERRREMAILRSVGARPAHVFALLVLESGMLALAGVVAGFAITWSVLGATTTLLGRNFGLFIQPGPPGGYDLAVATAVVTAGLLAGLVPAWRGYRNSLADGLSIRF